MPNIKYKYKVVVKSLDPSKYAKALAEKLFVEIGGNSDKTELIIESDQNDILLKRKFGIVSASDIVRIEDSEGSTGAEEKVEQKAQVEPKVIVSDSKTVEPKGEEQVKKIRDAEKIGSTEKFKMSTAIKLEVPVLQDISYQGIENYISDMKKAKKYGRFDTDDDLIFSSLVKSKKTHLFNDMAKGDDEDIDKYALFLKNIFGISEMNLLDRFKTLKQKEGENGLQFFNRLVRLFYKIREADVPETVSDNIHILEMTQAFLQGLRNRDVSKILSRNRKVIDFEKLGATALDYEKVEDDNQNAVVNKLDHLKVTDESSDEKKVNFVKSSNSRRENFSRNQGFNRNYSRNRYQNNRDFDRRSRDQSRERNFPRYRDNSRGRDSSRGRENSNTRYGRSHSRDQGYSQNNGFNRSMSRDRTSYQNRSQSRNRDFRGNRGYSRDRNQGQGLRRRDTINGGRCFRCGYKGHIRAECRANDKTVAAYNKRQERYQDKY